MTINADDTDADVPSVAEQLAELSRARAELGDTRLARLAAWACDVHLLETLLWENGLGEAPQPDAQLAAVGEAVAAAILETAGTVQRELSSRAVVELAREALLSTFDESVHDLVTERLAPLDHLDHVESGSTDEEPGHEADATTPRLEGRTPEHLVAELRATSADCMAVADLMAAEGSVTGAVRSARQADAAAFEAYLTTAAVLAGDDRLSTVDLRWALAQASPLSSSPASDTDPAEDVSVPALVERTRAALLGMLGFAEQGTLAQTFEPLPQQ